VTPVFDFENVKVASEKSPEMTLFRDPGSEIWKNGRKMGARNFQKT